MSYALKQLVTAGVRVFCYLSGGERTLNSPIEKAMLALQTMADEMEREKARQRTYDAMARKAKAQHVTGGRVFGYDNVDVPGGAAMPGEEAAKRSHVVRRIKEAEAATVRRIFELCAAGAGITRIAKQLNAEGAPSPRSQQGRPQGWAPSSVREVLYRPLYRGEIVWNQTRKRDQWGVKKQQRRPESEWLRLAAPELRVVPEELWLAAHSRLDTARRVYLRGDERTAVGPAGGWDGSEVPADRIRTVWPVRRDAGCAQQSERRQAPVLLRLQFLPPSREDRLL